jgi:CHAT domain-containing protein
VKLRLSFISISLKSWLLLAAVWLCLSYHTGNPETTPSRIRELYKKANQLFHLDNPTSRTDSMAMATFEQVIDEMQKANLRDDTTLFFSWLRKGILHDVKEQFTEAKNAYLQAEAIKKINPKWSDSLLYEVYIYAGTDYYHLNNFDSSNYFLLEAEALVRGFPGIQQKERLYNALGALYYERGNYLQSKNYFSQALDIVSSRHPVDLVSAMNFENNMAASFNKLGQYHQSLDIYNKLLTHNKQYKSATYNNMGKAYFALNKYAEAMTCYRRVNPNEVPGVLNELANTQLQLGHPDSAASYLDRWVQWTAQKKLRYSSMDAGTNHLYRASLYVARQQYEAALPELQQAIMSFSGYFKNENIYANPGNFTGSFTSYKLFDALYNKATTFEKLYQVQQKESWLQAASATYTSVISLLRYIEKSYDTDDAKLFLKNNSQAVYQHAFLVYLALHRLHPGDGYLEKAFITCEKSKASVMYAGLSERSFSSIPGIETALIQKERNIKYNLARLGIKGDQTQDSTALLAIAKERAAMEIELAQVQQRIEQNSAYYKQKYNDAFPGIAAIRERLSSPQALISFYVTPQQLHVFVITRADFKHAVIDSFDHLQQDIAQWLGALRTNESGRKFNGEKWGAAIYGQLVQPLQALAGNKEQWIIIPDNILYFLPFESLPAGNSETFLLETKEISYQFSARFVVAPNKENTTPSYSVLGFAPFAGKGMSFPHHAFRYMDQLPASGQEIDGLTGKFYMDQQATKQRFLNDINHYPVVHLATHAIADSSNSTASFIAFYPTTKTPAEDALYLEELYSLQMDATRLIIISACETGHGRLVNSEGVLSLTRGFAYAGCPSIVNSLWKADDAATSAILQQFHHYLKKGFAKSKALQRAKLDYLHSNAINKSPGFWAHLILTGDTTPIVAGKNYWWWLVVVILVLLAGAVLGKKRWGKMKKVDVGQS